MPYGKFLAKQRYINISEDDVTEYGPSGTF